MVYHPLPDGQQFPAFQDKGYDQLSSDLLQQVLLQIAINRIRRIRKVRFEDFIFNKYQGD
jgi:hypothetical protein